MRRARSSERDRVSVGDVLRMPARPTWLSADRLNLIADLQAALHERAVASATTLEPLPVCIPFAPLFDDRDERIPTGTTGYCCGHWGEYVQGGLEEDGWVRTVTVPVRHPAYARVRCELTPALRPGQGYVLVAGNRPKLYRVATTFLVVAGRWDLDVHLSVESNIPEGIGAGSSSAEACAAVRALKDAFDIDPDDLQVAQICFLGEGPTDALPLQSLGRAVRWLSRRGELDNVLRHPLPLLAGVGAVGGLDKVSTEAQAGGTAYDRAETREFGQILRRAQRALARHSPRDFIRACEASLDLNQRRCPTPRLAELREIGAEVGALGVIGSHSGTAAAIVFDRRSEGYFARCHEALREVRDRGFLFTHEFLTP